MISVSFSVIGLLSIYFWNAYPKAIFKICYVDETKLYVADMFFWTLTFNLTAYNMHPLPHHYFTLLLIDNVSMHLICYSIWTDGHIIAANFLQVRSIGATVAGAAMLPCIIFDLAIAEGGARINNRRPCSPFGSVSGQYRF
ncbi:MAG: hypothetical protein WKG06_13600 [Segetibacter sp.]